MQVLRMVPLTTCGQTVCSLGHPVEMEPLGKVRAPSKNLGTYESFTERVGEVRNSRKLTWAWHRAKEQFLTF